MVIRQILIILIIMVPLAAQAMENVFYVLHGQQPTEQALPLIQKHHQSINILISQAYHIDKKGEVTGFINPEIIAIAKDNKIKLMAMVTNSMFDKDVIHAFLASTDAQQKALQMLLNLCLQQNLYGIQFDFEMVPFEDRQALTNFYQIAADYFHKNHLVVSFAVAPVVENQKNLSAYQKKTYEMWAGAYDLAALGKSADFVTFMTYDQHLGLVAPGPAAGTPWVEAVIKNALKYIPANKVSLGIPTYSTFWYTGPTPGDANKIRMQTESIPYGKAVKILNDKKAHLQWNAHHQVNFAMYEYHWLNGFIFFENAKSFKAKLALVKKYHLRGISVFRLGIEDPKIWNVLKSQKK
jgi:spore germination protein YaaH